MKEINVENRLIFLAESFDVFNLNELKGKISNLKNSGFEVKVIEGTKIGSILGLLSVKRGDKEKVIKKISVSDEIFTSMLSADPTPNKICLQWMLNLFSRLLKEGSVESKQSALRLVEEDLPQAKEYLVLFEANKNKKKFKDLAKSNYSLKHVTDHSDINQYKSLGQLFESVDPFIIKNPSGVEKLLLKFVESGQAVIPVRDRQFTLFIPKTRDASVVFDKFANWCTAKEDNGMFKRYTEDYRKPNKKYSDIYIIVNNKFFTNESDELYQIHFESKQLKDKKNDSNVNIYDSVLSNSEGLSNFFYEELMAMAKESNKGIDNNLYLDYLIQFGFAESLFEFMNSDTPMIRFLNKNIPKLPDLSKFKMLEQLIIVDAKLSYIHPSIGNLKNMEMLSLNGNNIKAFPKEIGNLKKLEFLSFVGNKTTVEIPEEIKYLDKSNGGSLHKISVKAEEIGSVNYDNLRKWLPNVSF